MHVAELWRYPVKSLGGERLDEARVEAGGIDGDRVVCVRDARGRLLTARRKPRLLGLAAVVGADGEPLVDGLPWTDGSLAGALESAGGEGARLTRSSADEQFDDTPLLVATDGAIDHLGIDGRRLRPNLVVGGAEGLAEREWEGRRLRAGDAVLAVEHLCKRCAVTIVDPDTQDIDPSVLEEINRRLDGRVALNCTVAEPGRVAVGDPVELL